VFGIEDLFVAGIGFDIAGAWLVSRGLLARPEQLALRAATKVGANPHALAEMLKDRVSGATGLRR
jgi:hypothetical protein